MNILLIIIPGGDKIIYYNTFVGNKTSVCNWQLNFVQNNASFIIKIVIFSVAYEFIFLW